jgi:hypothetical protein
MLNAIDVATWVVVASFVVAASVHTSDVPAVTVHPLCPAPIATIS